MLVLSSSNRNFADEELRRVSMKRDRSDASRAVHGFRQTPQVRPAQKRQGKRRRGPLRDAFARGDRLADAAQLVEPAGALEQDVIDAGARPERVLVRVTSWNSKRARSQWNRL